jgi:acyl-CoA synthetase (AMP-forming)/AMP-acid ligase II
VNIATLLERSAQRAPASVAVVDEANGREYSYRAFVDRVFRTGARLRQLAFDEPGARVAILGDAGLDYLCADYGAMCSGLVRVPMDPHLSLDEAAGQIKDAGARVLLYDIKHAEMAARLRVLVNSETLTLAALEALDDPALPHGVRYCAPDEIASLNYTGGSTGRPKAVVHTHGSLSAAVQNIIMARPNGAGSVFLNVRPLWPIAAIVLLAHFVAGGTVVLGAFSPENFWHQIQTFRVNLTSLVPTQLVRILRAVPTSSPALPTLRSIDVGAAAIPIDVLMHAGEVFGPVVAMLYGLTEAPWCCYRSPDETARVDREKPETHGYVGRPLFGVEIKLMGPDGAVATGEVGEVHVRGRNVMRGYWNQPELTSDVLADAWFRTGDLGRIDEDGRLYLAGRAKSIIRTGGKSVQPDEVEAVLLQHPAVSEAAVVGVPDEEWGEIVVAAIGVHPDAPADVVADVMRHCREALSSYKRPKQIRVVDVLPRSHYGKVQSSKVREMFAETKTTA